MIVGLNRVSGKQGPLMNVGQIIVKSGIGDKVLETFMKAEHVPDLKINDCRFEIQYDSGTMSDEEPHDFRVIIYYPENGSEYLCKLYFEDRGDAARMLVELSLEQHALVDKLVRLDCKIRDQLVDSFVAPCASYKRSRAGIDWTEQGKKDYGNDIDNLNALIKIVRELNMEEACILAKASMSLSNHAPNDVVVVTENPFNPLPPKIPVGKYGLERGVVECKNHATHEMIVQAGMMDKIIAFYLKMRYGFDVPVTGRNMYGFNIGYKRNRTPGKDPTEFRIIVIHTADIGTGDWRTAIKFGTNGCEGVLKLSEGECNLLRGLALTDFKMQELGKLAKTKT